MKLIKKLLIPGVALSVLFGFSFADFLSCDLNGTNGYSVDGSTLTIDLSYCSNLGIDFSKYLINGSIVSSSDCIVGSPAKSFRFIFTNGIGNNLIDLDTVCSINVVNNKISFPLVNSLTSSNNSFYITFYNPIFPLEKIKTQVENSQDQITSQITSGEIGNNLSKGSSSIIGILIQILPYLIFIFIIGFIIRKVLIRFGMLKGSDGKIGTSIPKNNILNRKKYKGVVKK